MRTNSYRIWLSDVGILSCDESKIRLQYFNLYQILFTFIVDLASCLVIRIQFILK